MRRRGKWGTELLLLSTMLAGIVFTSYEMYQTAQNMIDTPAPVTTGRSAPVEPPARAHDYVSTFCFHELHSDCRLTCKTCKSFCLCKCHKIYVPRDGEEVLHQARQALITAAHDYNGIHRWRLIKLREALDAGLLLQDAADILGVARQTAARWCQ